MTQERKRGFEVITSYQDKAIQLPQRATHHAAGYDLEAAETIVVPSYWRNETMDSCQTNSKGASRGSSALVETNPCAYWA